MDALVEELVATRERHADRVLVVDGDGAHSYAQVAGWAENIAARLREEGFAGRPVALLLPSSAAYVAAFFGAAMAGCDVVPIDPRLVTREVDFLSRHAGCAAVISTDERPIADLPRIDPSVRGCHSRLGAPGEAPRAANVVLYTSGSTAAPRGVVLAPRAIIANARAWCDRYTIASGDRLLCALSMFHSFGMTAGVMSAVLAGARIIVVDEPLPARIATLSEAHGATVVLAVAAMYPWLVRSNGCPADAFAHVRLFLSGACSLPSDIARRFESKFARPIHQTYGLTEAGPVVTATPPAGVRIGTSGTALDGVQLRIVDDELQVRTPAVMRGYLRDEAATQAAIDPAGWLRTGDCARIDAEGHVTILGRRKDLIVRAGSKIYPQEIEEVLREHPAVDDAAVVGVAHEVYDEVPVAFVVEREGCRADERALIGFCRERLAAFKAPRAIRFVDALPRNANGKVLKRKLRGLATAAPLPREPFSS